jgi:hypothetical protein
MKKFVVTAMLAVSLFATSSLASLTYINPKGENNSNDPNLSLIGPSGILDDIYGLNNLTRIDDASDQSWVNTSGEAMAIAKVAGYSQNLGYQVYGSSTFNFLASFNNVTEGGNGTWITIPNPPLNFHFADNAKSGSTDEGTYSSKQSYNTNGQDHMVTWQITGNAGHANNSIGNYVIAFEDLVWNGNWTNANLSGSDRDYQDLVCEVSGVRVPEPGTLSLFLCGLIGMIGMGWIRRKNEA